MESLNRIVQFKQSDSDLRIALILMLPLLWKVFLSSPFTVTCALIAFTTAVWYAVFWVAQKRSTGFEWLYTTVLFCLLLPESATVYQIVLAISFGTVFGELIFGGRRHSFTSSVLLGLAFLFYSFDINTDTISAQNAPQYTRWALVLLSIVACTVYKAIDWLALLTIAVVLIVLTAVSANAPIMLTVPVVICVALLACDPLLSPKEQTGRLVYGGVLGLLLYLQNLTTIQFSDVVFVCLLGTVCAPLIDYITASLGQKESAPAGDISAKS